ncbi:FKBP-type peptidyl-prolyl cis-trans isomerase FkpA [Gillisia sp. Hel_I_86]|uniref:FKBP-type peptidyl-prolyl cis-trans isomerase n=1 Tax=Gillisia sp. Hel_I_86 TaxID=1249981 RepID=UPI001199C08D|nr:FKBP-type peptidyl-prolyl cis-trans isomerase [Gillisia sp. Hel_I_86]TVZ25331.1 FKBP-type peptidyl-prolyl cis-trans isomerase FkpA [Gillisia sp. Hel_I_86]
MKHPLLAFVVVLFLACDSKENENVDYKAQNEQDITAYIADKNLNAQKSDSGLYYVINEEGTGERPTSNSNVTVVYKGYYLNGSVFDQSDSNGISFNLQQVIKGWTEGITYFKEGGSGLLLVPAHLGYGNNDVRGIPGGSVLIFEVKLISVN